MSKKYNILQFFVPEFLSEKKTKKQTTSMYHM